nr:PREDICTED: kunitz-type serine protease inhibitor bitisilin-3-like [Anolis carolinensis]|eukprot:XP_008117944.1 PREDICTED: kunitz-type serine protease inhibitor bitisilin-3-like [Anolis carolinensis]
MDSSSNLIVFLAGLLAVMPVYANLYETCNYPSDPGPCHVYERRYFYNSHSKKCEVFYYGGCKGNENNFRTLRECQATCREPCYLPPNPGLCRGKGHYYYYNLTSHTCEKFPYGACKAIGNNFKTWEQCQYTCKKPGTCPIPPEDLITICPVNCVSDWACPGKEKCCNWGCMVDCMSPK